MDCPRSRCAMVAYPRRRHAAIAALSGGFAEETAGREGVMYSEQQLMRPKLHSKLTTAKPHVLKGMLNRDSFPGVHYKHAPDKVSSISGDQLPHRVLEVVGP